MVMVSFEENGDTDEKPINAGGDDNNDTFVPIFVSLGVEIT